MSIHRKTIKVIGIIVTIVGLIGISISAMMLYCASHSKSDISYLMKDNGYSTEISDDNKKYEYGVGSLNYGILYVNAQPYNLPNTLNEDAKAYTSLQNKTYHQFLQHWKNKCDESSCGNYMVANNKKDYLEKQFYKTPQKAYHMLIASAVLVSTFSVLSIVGIILIAIASKKDLVNV